MAVEIVTKEDLQIFRKQLIEDLKLLLAQDSNAFWLKLKIIIEDVVEDSKKERTTVGHIERPLLKVKEVCEIFQISKPTIYDWLKNGKLRSVKIQSRRYFHWQDVDKLIEQSKVTNVKSEF